ncbi:ABC transporter substrate-binding protein [Fusobacterium sp.]|uniref:ABC transporter substrate-binding protein n=1 Tax=Fusobacterium sp. TaxID=68766 RepID=UPI00290107BD|nr:ABC transporter substrate-binding protein [Fusobacterium sp.]MDU1911452.1 ABC transporter substrate-binding protein [Fusobacterium sp.]
MKKVLIFFIIIFRISVSQENIRIISLSHFSTRILIELEQEKKIAAQGWNNNIEFPEDIEEKLKDIPDISVGVPTKEKIYQYAPTHIIGWESAFTDKNIGSKEELKNNGIKIFSFESASTNGTIEILFDDLRKLGKLLLIENKIEEEIRKISENLKKFEYPNKGENILFISNVDKNPSLIGGNGLIQSISEKAGYRNVFGDINKNYFTADWENIIEKDIDNIIILAIDEKDFKNKYNKLLNKGYFNDKKAFSKNNIFYLNYIETAPSLHIAETAEKIALKKLYRVEKNK